MILYCKKCDIKCNFVEIFRKNKFHIMECTKCEWIIRKIIKKSIKDFCIINIKKKVETVKLNDVIV